MAKKVIIKWIVRAFITTIVVIAVYVTILAFPYPVFNYERKYNNITVRSDLEIDSSYDSLLVQVEDGLKSAGIYDPEYNYRAYLCRDRSKFAFYAKLCFRDGNAQGMNLSVFDYSFINESQIMILSQYSSNVPRHCIIEGDLVHAFLHEFSHQYHADLTGFFNIKRMPLWKTEGIVEYFATRAAIRDDSLATLKNRLAIYLDDSKWVGIREVIRHIYGGAILTEYLIDIEHLSIKEYNDPATTYDDAFSRMLSWHNNRLSDSI